MDDYDFPSDLYYCGYHWGSTGQTLAAVCHANCRSGASWNLEQWSALIDGYTDGIADYQRFLEDQKNGFGDVSATEIDDPIPF